MTSPAPTAAQTPPTPPRSRRRRSLRLLAALLGLLAAVLLAEVAVRVSGLATPVVSKRYLVFEDGAKRKYHLYADNPGGVFAPAPDTAEGAWRLLGDAGELPLARIAETPWCIEYRWETHGVRGPRVPAVPLPGVERVALVGDSFVLGEGVPHEHTLAQTLDGLTSEGVEFLNVGRSGVNLEFAAQAMGFVRRALNCSRAIIVLNPNDIPPSPAQREREQWIFDLVNLSRWRMEGEAEQPWLLRVSSAARLIDQTVRLRRITDATIQNYLDAADPAQNRDNIEAMREQFRSIAGSGVDTVVVLYPLLHTLDDYPLAAVHERLAALARSADLRVLDLAPAFAGRDASALWVHPADHHPNQRANEIAAGALRDWLETQAPEFLGR